MSDDKLIPLVVPQRWKLWIWGAMLALSGLGALAPDRLAPVLGVVPALMALMADALAVIALAGAAVSIRCPRCGLSLVWHGLTKKSAGAWLSWLLDVDTCPQCGYRTMRD